MHTKDKTLIIMFLKTVALNSSSPKNNHETSNIDERTYNPKITTINLFSTFKTEKYKTYIKKDNNDIMNWNIYKLQKAFDISRLSFL